MKKQFNPLNALLALLTAGDNNSNNNTATTGRTTAAITNQTNDAAVVKAAKEAYLFGLPLVLMDVSRRQMTDAASKNPMAKPTNTFSNMSIFPDAGFRDVVRPNADTYYSSAWLDLQESPVVLTVPNTHGRYYMMPMMDAYTNIFSSPGKRTTGTEAGNFLITGPKWTGDVPAGMKQIKSPTNMVWIIGRTQVNSKEDGNTVVVPIQKQYKLTPLSAWGKTNVPKVIPADPSVPKGSPNDVVKNMPVEEFFNYLNRLMVDNPPAAADQPAINRFAAINVKPGATFDLSAFTADEQTALINLPAEVLSGISGGITKSGQLINGWSTNMEGAMGEYGIEYIQRAVIAYNGLGANLKADAVYPSVNVDVDGNILNGANKYVLHFDNGKTPPANAFWSITMYDPDGYMVKNPINRNAIGDRDNLKTNADGSIDIYFQHDSPGKDKESNWLPAPAGIFNILMRVYWPKEEMLKGGWAPPAVMKIK